MTLLYIETSTKNCSVAISRKGELLCLCEESSDKYIHSEKLHLFVEWALEGAEISIKELDGVCVSKGPGGYTGLRIGVSAAKGYCFGLDVPLMSLNSLEILAHPQTKKQTDLIIPMIDARRMEVYTSVFDVDGNMLTPIRAMVLDETSFGEYSNKKIIFCGDGAAKAKDILNLPNAVYESGTFPSAENMIQAAEIKFKNKEFEDTAYFEPFYLKEFMPGPKKQN